MRCELKALVGRGGASATVLQLPLKKNPPRTKCRMQNCCGLSAELVWVMVRCDGVRCTVALMRYIDRAAASKVQTQTKQSSLASRFDQCLGHLDTRRSNEPESNSPDKTKTSSGRAELEAVGLVFLEQQRRKTIRQNDSCDKVRLVTIAIDKER